MTIKIKQADIKNVTSKIIENIYTMIKEYVLVWGGGHSQPFSKCVDQLIFRFNEISNVKQHGIIR